MATHENCPRYPSWAECGLRYNIADSQREPGEAIHQTEPSIPPIGEREHSKLLDRIRPIIEKHNRLHGYSTDRGDFYYSIAEQSGSDRMTEVTAFGKAEYTLEFTLDIQELLHGQFWLWRIMLDAAMADDVIFIYPECFRSNDASPSEPQEVTLARVNGHQQAWRHLVRRYACVDRPGLRLDTAPRLCEAKIIYNSVPDLTRPNWPVYTTQPIAEEPSVDEYLEFEKDLVPVIERHGPVHVKNDLSDTGKERRNLFWLIRTTELQWDRTRILVRYGTREFTDELIRDIQTVLKRWPLWRVALDAEDERNVRYIYPDFAR